MVARKGAGSTGTGTPWVSGRETARCVVRNAVMNVFTNVGHGEVSGIGH
jgi:hypothetical protein